MLLVVVGIALVKYYTGHKKISLGDYHNNVMLIIAH